MTTTKGIQGLPSYAALTAPVMLVPTNPAALGDNAKCDLCGDKPVTMTATITLPAHHGTHTIPLWLCPQCAAAWKAAPGMSPA